MIKDVWKSRKNVWFLIGIAAVFFVLLVLLVGPRLLSVYYFGQGKNAFDRGNLKEAEKLFTRSLTFNSKKPETHFYLGRISLGPARPGETILYPDADHPEAVSHYELAISLGIKEKDISLYAQALEGAGFSYFMLREYDKANEKFLEYITIVPNRAFLARFSLAFDYYNRLNKPREAFDVLLPALDGVIPDHQRKGLYAVYLLLANLSWYFGDADKAIEYAQLGLSTVPAAPETNEARVILHMRLALAKASKGQLNEALEEHSQAMAVVQVTEGYTPEQKSGRCSLAKIYFHAGDHQKAITIAESELGTQRKDYYFSRCLEVLGRSYLALKQERESKKYMRQYLEFTDAFEQKDILMQRNRDEFMRLLQ
jgi:tetratricopeptide (TPR) repeat protein